MVFQKKFDLDAAISWKDYFNILDIYSTDPIGYLPQILKEKVKTLLSSTFELDWTFIKKPGQQIPKQQFPADTKQNEDTAKLQSEISKLQAEINKLTTTNNVTQKKTAEPQSELEKKIKSLEHQLKIAAIPSIEEDSMKIREYNLKKEIEELKNMPLKKEKELKYLQSQIDDFEKDKERMKEDIILDLKSSKTKFTREKDIHSSKSIEELLNSFIKHFESEYLPRY